MTNAISTQRRTAEELRHLEQKKAELGIPPAIEFWPKTTATKKPTENGITTSQKDTYLTIDVPLRPGVKKSPTYERHIKLFTGGTPEEYCRHRQLVEEVISKLQYCIYKPIPIHKVSEADKSSEKTEDADKEEPEATEKADKEKEPKEKAPEFRYKDCDGNYVEADERYNEAAIKCHALFMSTLAGNALRVYQQAYLSYESETVPIKEKGEEPKPKHGAEDCYYGALNELACSIFPHANEAGKAQRRYLKEGGLTCCGEYSSPHQFYDRLVQLNYYLPFFPYGHKRGNPSAIATIKTLDDDELQEILDKARSIPVQKLMLANADHAKNYPSSKLYAERLEEWYQTVQLTQSLEREEQARKRPRDGPGTGSPGGAKRNKTDKRHQRGGGAKTSNAPQQRNQRTKPCVHCEKFHLAPDSQCWQNPANKNKEKDGERKPKKLFTQKELDQKISNACKKVTAAVKKKFSKKRTIEDSDDESCAVANMMQTKIVRGKASQGKTPAKKREPESDSDSDNSSYDEEGSQSDSDYLVCTDRFTSYAFYEGSRVAKKSREQKFTAEIIVEIEDKEGNIIPIRGLVDTGTSHTILLREFVKQGRGKGYKGHHTLWKTMGGNFTTNQKALIDFKLPQLDTNKTVQWVMHVDRKTDKQHALYDIILGMDVLCSIGLYVNTETLEMNWEGATCPLMNRGSMQDPEQVHRMYHYAVNPVLMEAEQRQARILDADYSKVDVDQYCSELQQLTIDQRSKLANVLKSYPILFGGGLGELRIDPIHLELKEDAKPYATRPFPIPQSLHRTTKVEIDRLTGIGVFELNADSEWAAPTFVQPKKTGDVRILTDFRKLNDNLKRKPYPLPKISDLLQRLRNFKWATAIDLSMGYYHIPLDKHSQKLCTTVLPWGKYRYRKLPMGIKNSPDIFQEIMNNIFHDLEFTSVYLDDILIISNGSFDDHLQKLKTVLERLEKHNFRANLRKCFFLEDELEYLGYQITRSSIQPQPKKVEAILKIQAPQTVRQLRHFLGMVNYYRDMWKRRSHILAPLSKLVSKNVPFKWEQEQEQAFQEIKRVIATSTALAYPDFTKPFHIYTDASNKQLGSVLMQEGKPLAFYSRKLNSAQRNYTTGEQELLSIVETLKEFRSLLWGQDVIVHTDHKNILYGQLTNERITRWRLMLEEYHPTFVHIKGSENVVADALSRLDFKSEEQHKSEDLGRYMAMYMSIVELNEGQLIPDAGNVLEMAECFSNSKDKELEEFPLHPELIAKYQQDDKKCAKYATQEEFKTRTIEGVKVLTRHKKLVVPKQLQGRILAWYHHYLRHPGVTRMEKTIGMAFWWDSLGKDVAWYVRTCRKCQIYKKVRKPYGKLPPKEAEEAIPWKRVNVDLIGPLTVKTPNKKKHILNALTMIDPATGWFEIAEVPERKAETVAKVFDDTWLSRYPRPKQIGFDNGGENKGMFKLLTTNYGLERKPTTPYNPQSNGIVERVHAVLNDILRTFELEKRDLDETNPWMEFLSAAAFAIRATYHTTLQATPAQLVFGRDMLIPITTQANWELIRQRRQEEINRNNDRENRSRIPHEYQVGEKVLLRIEGIKRKLSAPRSGPYEILRVYNNGTVRIQRGAVSERVNIRRITPFVER